MVGKRLRTIFALKYGTHDCLTRPLSSVDLPGLPWRLATGSYGRIVKMRWVSQYNFYVIGSRLRSKLKGLLWKQLEGVVLLYIPNSCAVVGLWWNRGAVELTRVVFSGQISRGHPCRRVYNYLSVIFRLHLSHVTEVQRNISHAVTSPSPTEEIPTPLVTGCVAVRLLSEMAPQHHGHTLNRKNICPMQPAFSLLFSRRLKKCQTCSLAVPNAQAHFSLCIQLSGPLSGPHQVLLNFCVRATVPYCICTRRHDTAEC